MQREKSNKLKNGSLIVSAEEVMHSRDHFKFRLSFSNLPSVGWLNPDPKVYAEIRRANESGGFELGKLPLYVQLSYSIFKYTGLISCERAHQLLMLK